MASTTKWVRAESRRATAALRRQIERSPLSQRRLEEKIGFSRGYLSRLLAGRLDLKVWHLMAILDALTVAPGRFFAQLYPRPDRRALETLRKQARNQGLKGRRALDRLGSTGVGDLGLDSMANLNRRLERCEQILAQLESLGIVRVEDPAADLPGGRRRR